MLSKISDEKLIRFFEDDLPEHERSIVRQALQNDPQLRARLEMLKSTADSLRYAFAGTAARLEATQRKQDPVGFGAVTRRTASPAHSYLTAAPPMQRVLEQRELDRFEPTGFHQRQHSRSFDRSWWGSLVAVLIVGIGFGGLVGNYLNYGEPEPPSRAAPLVPPRPSQTIVTSEEAKEAIDNADMEAAYKLSDELPIETEPNSDQILQYAPSTAPQNSNPPLFSGPPVGKPLANPATPDLPSDLSIEWKMELFSSPVAEEVTLNAGDRIFTGRVYGSFLGKDNRVCKVARIATTFKPSRSATWMACKNADQSWSDAQILKGDN